MRDTSRNPLAGSVTWTIFKGLLSTAELSGAATLFDEVTPLIHEGEPRRIDDWLSRQVSLAVTELESLAPSVVAGWFDWSKGEVLVFRAPSYIGSRDAITVSKLLIEIARGDQHWREG